MRPKNAGINLEPIPERERKKREKNTRVLCYTGKDWCVCFASHRRLLRASPRKIERRRRWWRTRFRRFRRFLLLDPVSRFSEGRSFSAFSLDVINYPRLICACATRRKKKRETKKTARRRRPKKRVVTGGVVTGVVLRGDCRVRRRLPPRRSTNKKREIN